MSRALLVMDMQVAILEHRRRRRSPGGRARAIAASRRADIPVVYVRVASGAAIRRSALAAGRSVRSRSGVGSARTIRWRRSTPRSRRIPATWSYEAAGERVHGQRSGGGAACRGCRLTRLTGIATSGVVLSTPRRSRRRLRPHRARGLLRRRRPGGPSRAHGEGVPAPGRCDRRRRLGGAALIRIEPWGEGDHALLQKLNSDPALMEHVGGPDSAAKIAERQERYSQPDSRQYKIVDSETGEGVGWVGYWEREWRGEEVYEAGWSLLASFHGRGWASAATRAMIAIAAAERDRRFMHAFPSPDNGRRTRSAARPASTCSASATSSIRRACGCARTTGATSCSPTCPTPRNARWRRTRPPRRNGRPARAEGSAPSLRVDDAQLVAVVRVGTCHARRHAAQEQAALGAERRSAEVLEHVTVDAQEGGVELLFGPEYVVARHGGRGSLCMVRSSSVTARLSVSSSSHSRG